MKVIIISDKLFLRVYMDILTKNGMLFGKGTIAEMKRVKNIKIQDGKGCEIYDGMSIER